MEVLEKMAHEESHHPKEEPRGDPVPDFQQALSNLSNPELLSALDLAAVGARLPFGLVLVGLHR